MPTEIYKTGNIETINGVKIEIIPLKIKFLKELMLEFEKINNEEDPIDILCECIRISMKQYYPDFSYSVNDIEENFDIKTIYKILKLAAGIDINKDSENPQENEIDNEKADAKAETWQSLDLAKLEGEAFLLGIWKNFEELESSISIDELMYILSTTRELDYQEKKFLAAMQGIDLEGSADKDGKERGQKEWEDMKARVFSRGQATDSRDILALQGQNAEKVGFGIGMGLSYKNLIDESKLVKK